ncbi:MAG: phage tail protein, partial [Candidatus Gastranaerophilales bacterium]|nr:phage tail protein [Candidatus Gastranaerophilales bacterium]
MSEYYAILTNDGMNEILESISGAREFDAATVAVGDSNGSYYEPTKDQTALKNLKYEGEPFKKGKRDNYLYFDLQIPASEGDYTIREAGVFSSDGKLLIIAKYPESIKTAADSASEKVLNIEIQIQLSDTIINTITIDESGNLATLDDLENKADRDLLNLTKTGQSQYNVFCINTGVVDDSGEPAFMTYSNGVLTTSGEFYCTLANGAIYNVEDSLTLDVSDYEDGTYNIFIDPVNLEIAALANSVYIDTVMPNNASDGDILLNISKLPYTLEMQGADNAPTYAYAGTLTVSGGGGGGGGCGEGFNNHFSPRLWGKSGRHPKRKD